MSDKTNADRRTLLAALGGAAVLGTISGHAQAQNQKPEADGITVTKEERPTSTDAKKPENLEKLKTTNDIEILEYRLLGGPTVFNGMVWVFKKDNMHSFTFGHVSKGPPPLVGTFEGDYYLDKDHPNTVLYDDEEYPRHGLWIQLVLRSEYGFVRWRYGHKRIVLPGWVWEPWAHPLKVWGV